MSFKHLIKFLYLTNGYEDPKSSDIYACKFRCISNNYYSLIYPFLLKLYIVYYEREPEVTRLP